MNFEEINGRIKPLCASSMEAAREKWDGVAKPVGSLGNFEKLITQLAGIHETPEVCIDKKAVIVMCGDNGVLAQGVAQTPVEVTAIMAKFIAARKSSVCRMSATANADVIAVDMGMVYRVDGLIDRRIGDGTNDFSIGAAMTPEQALQAVNVGIDLVKDCAEQGYKILATGEMGIGNTTTSSAISSVLLGISPEKVTGRGAGLSDEKLTHKISVIEKAIAVNAPDKTNPMDVLHKLGGFDIAGLVGVFLGGAMYRIPIVIDGFISSTSALVAARICPQVLDFVLPSHASAEPAAKLVLDAMGLAPILNADMRLGEGTGAVCMFPLLDMALSVYHTACTYADIGDESVS